MRATRLAVCAVAAAGLCLLLTAGSARAHHAFAAEFDANQPISLSGKVARVEWINPHSWIHIDVENDDGSVDRWMIEGGNPTALLRRGFTKASLPVGTEIMVEGYRAKGNPIPGQRPRSHVPGRAEALHGLVGHGRPARRSGSHGKISEQRRRGTGGAAASQAAWQ